jgi:hypothetical protein
MAFDNHWHHLCQAIRSQAEACADACPVHTRRFRKEAESFCAQAIPQTTPEMQMRKLSLVGIQAE